MIRNKKPKQRHLPTWQELQKEEKSQSMYGDAPLESYGVTFLDFSQYNGEPNIQHVNEKDINSTRQYPLTPEKSFPVQIMGAGAIKAFDNALKDELKKWNIPTGEGIIAQIQNTASTYNVLTKEKVEEYLKDLYFHTKEPEEEIPPTMILKSCSGESDLAVATAWATQSASYFFNSKLPDTNPLSFLKDVDPKQVIEEEYKWPEPKTRRRYGAGKTK